MGLAQKQLARSMVGDRQRVTVTTIAELELALVVGAPQVIGRQSGRRRRAFCAGTPLAAPPDLAVAVKHRMDGAFRRDPNVAGQAPHQKLADLARTPVRLLLLQLYDHLLDLGQQLVGIAYRSPRPSLSAISPCSL